MKCYKFRGRTFPAKFYGPFYSRKKLFYLISTNRSRLLKSGYFESQTWGALYKAWNGYIIAKNKNEINRLFYYAEVVQKLERELGLTVSSFPSLGLSPLEQDQEASKDYDPSDDFDRAMRSEQNSDPSEA